MRKEIYCEDCGREKSSYKICDNCGERLRDYCITEIGTKILDLKGNPISFNIEGQEYDFCSLKCLLKFVIEELEKENQNA